MHNYVFATRAGWAFNDTAAHWTRITVKCVIYSYFCIRYAYNFARSERYDY